MSFIFNRKESKRSKSHGKSVDRAKTYEKETKNLEKEIMKLVTSIPLKSPEMEIQIRYRNEISTKIVLERFKANDYTCSWLRREAERSLNRVDLQGRFKTEIARMVALKTVPTNLALDYLLTIGEKTLDILPDKILLEPIISPEKVETITNTKEHSKLTLSDFDIIGLLGTGKVSRIYLVRKKANGAFYALKQIPKDVLQERQIKKLIKERDNLLKVRNCKSVKLHNAFQTENFCYFVLQFCAGGDLGTLLRRNGPLTEDQAKYYIIEVLKGLKLLHAQNIMFRDITPGNLLMDLNSEIFFADFGVSKKIKEENTLNYSICGEPELNAPEVLKNEGYSYSADFYNIGTLAYKLVLNKYPFDSKKGQSELRNDILTKEVDLPQKLSVELQDFLQQLLEKNPKKRLGKNGIEEILSHPWLRVKRTVMPIRLPPQYFETLLKPCDLDIDNNISIDDFSPKWYDEREVLPDTRIRKFSLYSQQESVQSDAVSVRTFSNYDPQDTIMSQETQRVYKKCFSIGDPIIPDEVSPTSPVNKAFDSPVNNTADSPLWKDRSTLCLVLRKSEPSNFSQY